MDEQRIDYCNDKDYYNQVHEHRVKNFQNLQL